MNIAQMAAFQMKRPGGNTPAEGVSAFLYRGIGKAKSAGGFSGIFDNTLKKTETANSETNKPETSKPEAGKPETSKPETGKPTEGGKTLKRVAEERPNQESEIKSKSKSAAALSDEAEQTLILQIADLLKLIGISADQNDASQAGGLHQDLKQLEQAGDITLAPSAKEAVLRLLKILGRITGEGGSSSGTPFLQELKGLTEAQLSELDSLPDEKFLTKLVKVLEKALGEHPARKTDLPASTVPENQMPVIEPVSGNSSEKGRMESGTLTDNHKLYAEVKPGNTNSKGSENSGRDAGQNGSNSFGTHESEMFNPRDVRPAISVNGFNAVNEALSNGQQAPAYKLAHSIFGQIAEKARVIVLPELTEMQIQLKPGFLGKLNMSISSENGTVTARFSAETQAVKAIIEANLGSLKDTLNQQGIKVDQLIVDIGTHNHRQGFGQGQNMYRGHNSKSHRVSVNTEEIDRMFSSETKTGALKGFYGSTVEFTA